jgi:hypothetical protein
MREHDMRQRVEQFLQTRLRKMIAPATLGLGLAGLGLATTGCPSSGLDANDDGGAMVNKDAGADQGMVLKYMAQMPDAGLETSLPQPEYMAPVPPDAGIKLDTLGTPIYSAPAPDAGPVMRYMAQMPDASSDGREIIALYMAQLPFGSS